MRKKPNPRKLDLTGQVFGRIRVIEEAERSTCKNMVQWTCECECGKTKTVLTCHLRSGHTTSCGCLRIENTKAALTKHGCADGTPEYRCWKHIHWRTSNQECPQYKDYGGRGIKVCERRRSFENFLEDMGERPSSKHSIDRINNELGYQPGNCRWATHGAQAVNKRNNRFVTYQGETRTISQWSKLKNIRYLTLYYRLAKTDMPLELAMETPAGGFKK